MILHLVRHGESQANTGEIPHGSIGDHKVPLTEKGKQQARFRGAALRDAGFGLDEDYLIYCSPYRRARETLACILEGNGIADASKVTVYEDPRLREVDHGYSDVAAQDAMRAEHGWFYYRFKEGESPADCFDRCCTFLESLKRQVYRKFPPVPASLRLSLSGPDRPRRVLIVSHGLTLRCFVTRYMHLTVEQFETLANPHNCDLITITPHEGMKDPQFISGRWGIEGLRFRGSSNRSEA